VDPDPGGAGAVKPRHVHVDVDVQTAAYSTDFRSYSATAQDTLVPVDHLRSTHGVVSSHGGRL